MNDETYTAQIPVVTSASITPNPAVINSSVLLKVFCVDETVILHPSYYQAGEIQCGEG